MCCEQKLGDHDRVKKMKEKVASMENQEKNIYFLSALSSCSLGEACWCLNGLFPFFRCHVSMVL